MPEKSENLFISVSLFPMAGKIEDLVKKDKEHYLLKWKRVQYVKNLEKECAELQAKQQKIIQDLENIIAQYQVELNAERSQINFHIRGSVVSETDEEKEKHKKISADHYQRSVKIIHLMNAAIVAKNDILQLPKVIEPYNFILEKGIEDLRHSALSLKKELEAKETELESLHLSLGYQIDVAYVQFFERVVSREVVTQLDKAFEILGLKR